MSEQAFPLRHCYRENTSTEKSKYRISNKDQQKDEHGLWRSGKAAENFKLRHSLFDILRFVVYFHLLG